MKQRIKVEIKESRLTGHSGEPLWKVWVHKGSEVKVLEGFYKTYANAAMDAHIEVSNLEDERDS